MVRLVGSVDSSVEEHSLNPEFLNILSLGGVCGSIPHLCISFFVFFLFC